MPEVTRHEVSGQRMAEALDDITGRARRRWHSMRYDDPSPRKLKQLGGELFDHVAARTVRAPALDEASRVALETAAHCALGALSIGCFPNGDQEIALPLLDERLSSEDIAFGDAVDQAPTARTWLDAFEMCLVSGLVWDWERVIGLLLRGDFAPAIRDGVPYSELTSASDPRDVAAMDALCGYLTEADGHLPRDWPTVPLRKPDADERAGAARRLDATDSLTPDQRLLRVLLDDDRTAFEQALTARLVEHRQSVGPDPAPGSLLPLGALALATLAVQAHGWDLGVRSGYLPDDLLGSPQALQQAEAIGVNNLGYWAAK
ncbi:immunity 49 family protein [Streptomyces sp. 5-8]|uniref:Immunity 49 family protein n=1 Tax=Streptomyces musisoli TaxID=2802280 RepID=A0ABS1P8Z6_9ACTN|nr:MULTISPECIES: immunity 49 family protein [Streptomyces]MBL1108848.1 immunity 49 family protein [Streptomyces musisoli]MBY8842976.1 immunity 49 family protein [Streptomyces sp. SP2-10]